MEGIEVTYRDTLRSELDAAVEEEERTDAHAIIRRMKDRHAGLIQEEASRLIEAAMYRDIKSMARTDTGEGEQMELLGLPHAITVPKPDGDGFDIVRTDKARWPDLSAGAALRAENAARAQAKVDVYTAALSELRPLMEGTDRTVGEALAILSAQNVTDDR